MSFICKNERTYPTAHCPCKTALSQRRRHAKRPPQTSRGAFLRALPHCRSRMQKPFRSCNRKGRSPGAHTISSAASRLSRNGFLLSRRRTRQAVGITTAHGLRQAFSKGIAAVIRMPLPTLALRLGDAALFAKEACPYEAVLAQKTILPAATAQGRK